MNIYHNGAQTKTKKCYTSYVVLFTFKFKIFDAVFHWSHLRCNHTTHSRLHWSSSCRSAKSHHTFSSCPSFASTFGCFLCAITKKIKRYMLISAASTSLFTSAYGVTSAWRNVLLLHTMAVSSSHWSHILEDSVNSYIKNIVSRKKNMNQQRTLAVRT